MIVMVVAAVVAAAVCTVTGILLITTLTILVSSTGWIEQFVQGSDKLLVLLLSRIL